MRKVCIDCDAFLRSACWLGERISIYNNTPCLKWIKLPIVYIYTIIGGNSMSCIQILLGVNVCILGGILN